MADFEINTPDGPAVNSKYGIFLLSDILDFNSLDGTFTWNPRTEKTAHDIGRMRTFNVLRAGKPALNGLSNDGYCRGMIFGRSIRAHRAVYAMVNGQWPNDLIDHINGKKQDNRPENLRDVSSLENHRNIKIPASNTSGAVGVDWAKSVSMWRANIKINGKTKFLGHFENKSDAIKARAEANVKYGFHPNHGRCLT